MAAMSANHRPEPEPNWNRSAVGEVSLPSRSSAPSVMRMGAHMDLHSHLAINLFRGRRSDPGNGVRVIVGLARFARQVALVWSAAEQDDPYADQCLLDIEIKFEEAKHLLDEREKTLAGIVDGMEGLTVDIQTSVRPARIDLQFYCPWAFRAAQLLIQFDRVVRLGLTARHLGLFGNDDWSAVVRDSSRVLRHIFALPTRWINTGVTREDFRKKNKVTKRALARYAEIKDSRLELSEAVLRGEVRAKLAPSNKALERYLASAAV
jgi:integrating conjugative element protein (TIGR03761 family)